MELSEELASPSIVGRPKRKRKLPKRLLDFGHVLDLPEINPNKTLKKFRFTNNVEENPVASGSQKMAEEAKTASLFQVEDPDAVLEPDDRDLDPRQNCDSDDDEDVLQVLTLQNLSCGINHLENQ
jgi:hypothetical protein